MARVLVAEDDADIRQLVLFQLEREGHEVTAELDGESALAHAVAHPPDLAVLDWMMPRMTGLEVCLRLRETVSTAHVPVLMLTARAREQDAKTALAAGADDYMVKPFLARTLAERVNALLLRARSRA